MLDIPLLFVLGLLEHEPLEFVVVVLHFFGAHAVEVEHVALVCAELLVGGHHAHHGEHVGDHGALDLQVQGAVGVEGGGEVDLQQPGAQVVIQQDIESQHLEAVCAVGHIHLHRTEHSMFDAEDRLDDQVVNARPNHPHVVAGLPQVLP